METLFGKALGDLATLAKEKWYTAMGMLGLFIFAWVLLFGTPHDDVLVGAIAVAMIGFGFGEAETRVIQRSVGNGVTLKRNVRLISVPGLVLYALGIAAVVVGVTRLI
jgi:hypothetical protein